MIEYNNERALYSQPLLTSVWKQAVFALAWFRDRPDIRRLGAGFGISRATAYRYKDEAAEGARGEGPVFGARPGPESFTAALPGSTPLP